MQKELAVDCAAGMVPVTKGQELIWTLCSCRSTAEIMQSCCTVAASTDGEALKPHEEAYFKSGVVDWEVFSGSPVW